MTSYEQELQRKLFAIYALEDIINERIKTAHNYERAVLLNESARLQIECDKICDKLDQLEMQYQF